MRPTSRFYYDPELAAFVKKCFYDRLIYKVIREKCIEKFGLERSPSKTAIGVFCQKLPIEPD